jgi:predicted lipoprotein
VLQELIGVMAHGVEAIRDQRILPFLGREGEASKPKSALFWRSGMTARSVLANFEGLRDLLMRSDIWEYAPTEQFRIGQEAIAEFGKAEAEAAKVAPTVDEAVADPAQKAALAAMVASSQVLGKLLGEELPAALGLSVGFSSLDGD